MLTNKFLLLDNEGVGSLIAAATTKVEDASLETIVGICGEHGGDPKSINFFNSIGIDYVSCNPYKIPIARLAAAQAQIKRVRDLYIDTKEDKEKGQHHEQ